MDVIVEQWKWRSDIELAQDGLFRSKSYRPELDKPREDGCEIGSRQVGILLQKNDKGRVLFVRDDELWACRFNELLRYKQKFQNDNVMSSIEGSNMWEYNRRLARWVYTQRQQYAKLKLYMSSGGKKDCSLTGYKSHLTVKRIEALNAIGFVWSEPQFMWERRLDQLKKFQQSHGHCRVPNEYDSALSKWIIDQRQKLLPKMTYIQDSTSDEAKTNDLSLVSAKTKIDKLNKLGFVWFPHEVLWNKRFKQLGEYVEKNGHALVFRSDEDTYIGLAAWVSRQRRQFRIKNTSANNSNRSPLTDARIDALKNLGFVWDIAENRFEQKYFELSTYKNRHGDCLVPYCYHDSNSLGVWVSDLRQEYIKFKNGDLSSLSDSHISALDKIGFQWESQLSEWNDMLELVKDFKAKFDHCCVPQSYTENPKLGRWVNTQRSEYKKFLKGKSSKMTTERIEKLNAIDFVWDPFDKRWYQKYEALSCYVKEYGDALVPRIDIELGRWVDTQRQQYRKLQRNGRSSMTEDKVKLLENLGFVWYLR